MTPKQVERMKVPLLDLQAQYATIRDDVRAAIDRVFESQQFVLSAEVQALEEEIARYSQTKFGVGCASGSDALLLALMSCGVGDGDEVITTPFSFFATASAITRLGARPVFVDIDEHTYNIRPTLVTDAITERTKAIVPVHLYGQCAEMDPLIELAGSGGPTASLSESARQRGIPIIEDAAQAIGAEDHGRRAGSMGTIGCLSFYPSKNLGGAGDGGMLVTNDLDHARRLHMLRVHGEERKYFHKLVGLNSRLDALQAAVLRAPAQRAAIRTDVRRRRLIGKTWPAVRAERRASHLSPVCDPRAEWPARRVARAFARARHRHGRLLSGAAALAGMLCFSWLQGRRLSDRGSRRARDSGVAGLSRVNCRPAGLRGEFGRRILSIVNRLSSL